MKKLLKSDSGQTQVEQIVLVVTVAIGVAAGVILLGSRLLNYHKTIESILALPIP
jgi:Flp pilus assembly pilin Flp